MESIVDLTDRSVTLARAVHRPSGNLHRDEALIGSHKELWQNAGELFRWTAGVFESKTFPAAFEPEISLIGTTIEKISQITQWRF